MFNEFNDFIEAIMVINNINCLRIAFAIHLRELDRHVSQKLQNCER